MGCKLYYTLMEREPGKNRSQNLIAVEAKLEQIKFEIAFHEDCLEELWGHMHSGDAEAKLKYQAEAPMLERILYALSAHASDLVRERNEILEEF